MHKIKGSIYSEYFIVLALVLVLFVISIKMLGNTITYMVTNEILKGNKIKLTVGGIVLEKAGKYGGTKSTPIMVKLNNGKVALDFGYICLDNVNGNPPKLSDANNQYATETLRNYVEILELLRLQLALRENKANQAECLKVLTDVSFDMANMIDEIAINNGKKSNLPTYNIKVSLKPIQIVAVDDSYLIKNYPLFPQNTSVDLKLLKSDFTMLNEVGFIYTSANRVDDEYPMFLWLVMLDPQNTGKKEPYTMVKSQENYTSLENTIVLDFQLLKPVLISNSLDSNDYRSYSLLKIFNVYSDLYLKNVDDDISRLIVDLVKENTQNIVTGVNYKSNPDSSTLNIGFMPQEEVVTNLPETLMKSLTNVKYKNESDYSKASK